MATQTWEYSAQRRESGVRSLERTQRSQNDYIYIYRIYNTHIR